MDEEHVYICGPLTGLDEEEGRRLRHLYEEIGELCYFLFETTGFVPHKHFDPIENPDPSPRDVDFVDRTALLSSWCLVAIADHPSWGGGIEVEIARSNGIPVILLWKEGTKVSKLLRGNQAIRREYEYSHEEDALEFLEGKLQDLYNGGRTKETLF